MKNISFTTDMIGEDMKCQHRLTVSYVGQVKDVEKLSAALQQSAINLGLLPRVTGADVSARTQQFLTGDLVQIADDLGTVMCHFKSGVPAIVIGSYADKYGRGSDESYTLLFEDGNQSAWYEGHHLTLIEPARFDLYSQWIVK